MGAPIGGLGAGVARTNNHAIRQHHRRPGPVALELWNRNVDVGGFDKQFHVAQIHRLTRKQPGFPDRVAIDKRAIG